MFEELTRGHIVFAVVIVVTFVLILVFGLPYHSHVRAEQAMREEVRWAETWRAVYHTLPEGTDLTEYMLMRKIEDTDIEEIK
jgi:hypothetical protein